MVRLAVATLVKAVVTAGWMRNYNHVVFVRNTLREPVVSIPNPANYCRVATMDTAPRMDVVLAQTVGQDFIAK